MYTLPTVHLCLVSWFKEGVGLDVSVEGHLILLLLPGDRLREAIDGNELLRVIN